MQELTYHQEGEDLIPNLAVHETSQPIGKYGRMRKKYLQANRPLLWNQLILSEGLYPHLLEIEQAANERLDRMLPEMAAKAGVTERLKAEDALKWVGLMNTIKAQAEEIVLHDLIYA